MLCMRLESRSLLMVPNFEGSFHLAGTLFSLSSSEFLGCICRFGFIDSRIPYVCTLRRVYLYNSPTDTSNRRVSVFLPYGVPQAATSDTGRARLENERRRRTVRWVSVIAACGG